MAVQAQCPPSDVHPSYSWCRNKQEGFWMDCSLQSQPGGGVFLDHHGATINGRKRQRREASLARPFNLHPQPQPLQFIELSQLRQNPHQNDQRHHHQQGLACEFINSCSSLPSSGDFASHVKQQRDEFDQFLVAQGGILGRALAEKLQRHYREILAAAEEAVAMRMMEKQVEVEKAKRRNVELDARAGQLAVEVHVWQTKARAQEAAAASLQAQLQQAIICSVRDRVSPEEGRGGRTDTEDAESAYIDPDRVASAAAASGPSCRACRRRDAAAVLLPCRHLSLCMECTHVARTCPLCLAPMESIIEVYLS
ncbi:hypothetical protein SAY87_012825 [Trapa incisa]|uniref:RING-type domain-containing protein n=1 Tax=Trapa incisa TaxID=236973 RepID=A0AAN7JKJ8_9MYRT|nr:hypothetical protein SAY87_012825 [Trapa incisa]